MNIEEGNIIIAEFMEWVHPFEKHSDLRKFHRTQLQYHSSFDWLMVAWDKIYHEIILSEWYKYFKTDESEILRELIESSIITVNIESAFENMYVFLQWYFKNKA